MAEKGQGSVKALISNIKLLKQNTIDLLYQYNMFQNTIGYPVNERYNIQMVCYDIIEDFSDDIICLLLKVIKYPMENM